jgi:hypothetical protein
MAFIPGFAGRAAEANGYLAKARQQAGDDLSPTMDAWLFSASAEVFAMAGEPYSSLAALGQAEIALGRQRRQTDPEWQDWFSPGQFASFKGYSLLKADQPREAEVPLQAALDGLQTPSSDKQVAVVVADLADAHVAGPAARPVACPPAPRRRLLAGEQPGAGGERDPVDRRELSATPAEPRASIVGRHGHVEQS